MGAAGRCRLADAHEGPFPAALPARHANAQALPASATYVAAAYIFAGGLPFELTEGDLLAVFSQYGEIVDVNLCRDPKTGARAGAGAGTLPL